jgi:hypothetical protein
MPPPGRGRGRGVLGRGRGRGHPPPVVDPHPHHHPHPHPQPVVNPAPVVAPQQVFERLYEFKVSPKEVVIQHSLGKYLRVKPGNMDALDYEGGTGKFARWKCFVHDNGSVIQLQSEKTGKFLRVKPDGNDFDVQGVKIGKFTYFELEKLSTGIVHMKTREKFHGGKHAYLAVMHGNLPQKRLKFFIEGSPRNWQKPYLFAAKNTCVVEHSGLDNLRSDADGHAHANGGVGDAAQWEVIPDHNTHTVQLRNKKHGGYLRIHDDNVSAKGKGGKFTVFKVHHLTEDKNYVKLESVSYPGKFVAVDQQGVRVGVGGKFCALTFYKE